MTGRAGPGGSAGGAHLRPPGAGRGEPPLVTDRLELPVVTAAIARAVLHGDLADLPDGLHAAPGWPTADTVDGLRMEPPDGVGSRLVVRRDTREVIGELGWKGGPDATGTAEIGYGLAVRSRRRGYGTEAVRAFTDWVLGPGGAVAVRAEVVTDNLASRRLLERIGFELDRVDRTVVWYRRERG